MSISFSKGLLPVSLLLGSLASYQAAGAVTPGPVVANTDAAIAAAASPAAFANVARGSWLSMPVSEAFLPFQPVETPSPSGTSTSSADPSTSLPDAPVPMPAHAPAFFEQSGATGTAPLYTKYIPSGWTAQRITAHDKVIIGLRDLYSPLNFLAMAASAGYSHLTDGEPNYGTNSKAFGQRFGAAAARETSQGLFTDSIFAPLLHQDPRYYVEGEQYGFVHRALYAATRPLITRTDGGHSTVNASLLLGYAAATALTQTYYPQINRNFHDEASTFGGSIGGAALGFVVSEFSDQLLKAVHMKK